MSFENFILTINSSVLVMLVVDYIRFRVQLYEKMNKNFVTADRCAIVSASQNEKLDKIEKSLEQLNEKFDRLHAQFYEKRA